MATRVKIAHENNVSTIINGKDAKTTPHNDDVVGLVDSEASSVLKKLSWTNIKATLKTYFDTLYAAALGEDDNYVTNAEKTVIGNTSGTNSGDEPDATESVKGVSELATDAEVTTGTATDLVITPAHLKSGTVTMSNKTLQDASMTNNVYLQATSSSSVGVIEKNSARFIHDYKADGADGNNTFMGVNSGNFTMAIGGASYHSSSNTGVGKATLGALTVGFQNTAVGLNSLNNATEGHNNTSVGKDSLANDSTGDDNVGVGYDAGDTISTGNKNTIIGAGADVSASNVNNEIVIGNSAAGNGTNTITLGDTNITEFHCQVSLTVDSDERIKKNIVTNKAGLDFICALNPITFQRVNPADYPKEIKPLEYTDREITEIETSEEDIEVAVKDALEDIDIKEQKKNKDGKPVFATEIVQEYAYDKKGNVKQIEREIKTPVMEVVGQVKKPKKGIRFNKEDGKFYKKEIKEIEKTYIKKAEPRPEDNNNTYIGLIAQDVEEAINNQGLDFKLVDTSPKGKKSIRYGDLIIPLIKAVQELSTRVKNLETK
jgi:hypothetical protein